MVDARFSTPCLSICSSSTHVHVHSCMRFTRASASWGFQEYRVHASRWTWGKVCPCRIFQLFNKTKPHNCFHDEAIKVLVGGRLLGLLEREPPSLHHPTTRAHRRASNSPPRYTARTRHIGVVTQHRHTTPHHTIRARATHRKTQTFTQQNTPRKRKGVRTKRSPSRRTPSL